MLWTTATSAASLLALASTIASPMAPPAAAPAAAPDHAPAAAPLAAWTLRFEPQTLDLGDMVAGVKKTGTITVRNVGAAPAQVSRIVPACGCTTTSAPPRDPVPPGAAFTVDIAVDPGIKSGVALSKMVTFQVDGCEPQKLAIKGQVRTHVAMEPEVLEAVAGMDAKVSTLKLESRDDIPFTVIGVSPPGFATVPAGADLRREIAIDWNKWRSAGRPEKLTIATDHPDAAQLFILVKPSPAVSMFRLPGAAGERTDQTQARQDEVLLEIDRALAQSVGVGGFALKIHRETGMLFAYGSDAQLAVVRQVVDQNKAVR
jgi:hypothetical protein